MTAALNDFVHKLTDAGWTLEQCGEQPWQLKATRPAASRHVWQAPRPARRIATSWRSLSLAAATDCFDPAMITRMPPTARRWLIHAIGDGAALSSTARLRMRGEIRLGKWRAFHADQVLAPGRGFIWAATTSLSGIPVSGYDRFTDGHGEMHWRLGGLVPVMSTRGPEVTRSAAGRLIGESVLVPTTFRSATWSSATHDSVDMEWSLTGGHRGAATLTLAADGALRKVRMQRWGNPFGHGYNDYSFVVELDDERSFGGITIPTTLTARWEDGVSINEFYRAEIVDASYA